MLEGITHTVTQAWRPEHKLLLCCARTRHSPATSAKLESLLAQPMDWDYVTETAFRHGVMPLLHRSIQGTPSSFVPDNVKTKVRLAFLANAGRNHYLAMELMRILALFGAAGIPAVPFKGPVLAASVYGDVALRQFSDLDILIHRQDAIEAKNVLNSTGYGNAYGIGPSQEAMLIGLQKDFQLISRAHGTIVELHWSLDPEKPFQRFSDVTIWERLGEACLDGSKVSTLSAEDLLLYLCMHGANHCWDRVSWISDVAEVLIRYPFMDWELVLRQARNLGTEVRTLLGLSLARGLLAAPIPAPIERMAAGCTRARKTALLVARRLFAGTAAASKLGKTFAFHLNVRDSVADRIRLCLRRATVPDATDLQWIGLPGSRAWLLFALRPVRLMSKHLDAWVRRLVGGNRPGIHSDRG